MIDIRALRPFWTSNAEATSSLRADLGASPASYAAGESGDELVALGQPATLARGFPSRAELAASYAAGQYGKVDPGIEEFARLVERLADAADEAERGG